MCKSKKNQQQSNSVLEFIDRCLKGANPKELLDLTAINYDI